MAINLSKTEITDGNVVYAWEVSQSIDALKGNYAYNLNPSGSIVITGSFKVNYSSSLNIDYNYITQTSFNNVYNTIVLDPTFVTYANFVNDFAALIGGIPIGGLYHNNGILTIRQV